MNLASPVSRTQGSVKGTALKVSISLVTVFAFENIFFPFFFTQLLLLLQGIEKHFNVLSCLVMLTLFSRNPSADKNFRSRSLLFSIFMLMGNYCDIGVQGGAHEGCCRVRGRAKVRRLLRGLLVCHPILFMPGCYLCISALSPLNLANRSRCNPAPIAVQYTEPLLPLRLMLSHLWEVAEYSDRRQSLEPRHLDSVLVLSLTTLEVLSK